MKWAKLCLVGVSYARRNFSFPAVTFEDYARQIKTFWLLAKPAVATPTPMMSSVLCRKPFEPWKPTVNKCVIARLSFRKRGPHRSVSTNSGADSMGHWGHVPPSPVLQMGGTVSRTANKKLTKLYWPCITKALTKTTNCTFRAKKVEGHDQKIFFSLWIGASPHFQIRSGATVHKNN